MNLDQFKQWALSQGQVAKTDGGYPGQCVSLINQYLSKVYGIQAGAWGDAKDWATNKSVAQYFDRVNDMQPGDIIVYPGSFGGGYGHIAIYLGGNQMLDQNGSNNLRVAVRQVWPGYSAILRRKGTPVATDIWQALDATNKRIDNLEKILSQLFIKLDESNKRLDKLEAAPSTPGSLDGLYEIKKKG